MSRASLPPTCTDLIVLSAEPLCTVCRMSPWPSCTVWKMSWWPSCTVSRMSLWPCKMSLCFSQNVIVPRFCLYKMSVRSWAVADETAFSWRFVHTVRLRLRLRFLSTAFRRMREGNVLTRVCLVTPARTCYAADGVPFALTAGGLSCFFDRNKWVVQHLIHYAISTTSLNEAKTNRSRKSYSVNEPVSFFLSVRISWFTSILWSWVSIYNC